MNIVTSKKSGVHHCSSWSAWEMKFTMQACCLDSVLPAHLLWSPLAQLRSAVKTTGICGNGWVMPPSSALSHSPFFSCHPLQDFLFSCNLHSLLESSTHEEGELRMTPAQTGQCPHQQGTVPSRLSRVNRSGVVVATCPINRFGVSWGNPNNSVENNTGHTHTYDVAQSSKRAEMGLLSMTRGMNSGPR